ncbi:MAG: Rossmann-like and DUF2520 domain-containing protein [Egibacteraceae bacterium]
MRVGVIGPGRVGTALALALPWPAYEVVAVAGRGEITLARFAAAFPGVEVRPVANVGAEADLVLICVPDDALEQVVREVAKADGVVEGSRWVHTSGGYGPEALRPLALCGAHVAACHPAMTFPDPDRGLERLPGASWAVTAASEDLAWARILVTDLRGSPITVPAGARTLYHAGLAVGSNATATVVTLARDLLLGAGVQDPNAFLGPLVTTSAAGAAERGIEALTGPVRRGDAQTVAKHLKELREVMPEAVDAYVALSSLALRYARRAGLDDEAAQAVTKALAQEQE